MRRRTMFGRWVVYGHRQMPIGVSITGQPTLWSVPVSITCWTRRSALAVARRRGINAIDPAAPHTVDLVEFQPGWLLRRNTRYAGRWSVI